MTDDPCADCGGACCSFRRMRISCFGLDEGQRYDSAMLEYEHVDTLVLSDGEVPDMDWYVIEHDGRRHLAFECGHLDDGRCGVYDRRPEMCRSFECGLLKGEVGLDEFMETRMRDEGEVEAMEVTEVTGRVREIIARRTNENA